MTFDLTIAFNEQGAACVYDDALAPTLEAMGKVSVVRASHVEPAQSGGWLADMSPSGDDVQLGPFPLRQQALDAERAWLKENRGL